MEPTPNTAGDDIVTIAEALKRLEKQAPARQSFYAAVNKGKIRKVANETNNPGEKFMISWASVLEYIEHGGFKSRQKPVATTTVESETKPVPTGTDVTTAAMASPAKPRDSGKRTKSDKRNRASLGDRSKAKSEGKSITNINARGRRTLRLRSIKDSLRDLDYEQTKAIRDWADNRLLTVLRPAPPPATSAAGIEKNQPA